MAKKSSQRNENTTTKQKKSTTRTKEPLISTRKKVGIAIYFTFLATLAGVIGVQMLISQNFGEPLAPTDTYSTTINDDTQKPIDNNQPNSTNNYNNYPIDENAPNHNVATPFDTNTTTTKQNTSSQINNQTQINENAPNQPSNDLTYASPSCPDGNCNLITSPTQPDSTPTTQNDCPNGNCILPDSNCPDGNCIITETCNDDNCTTTDCKDGICTTTDCKDCNR